MTDNKTHTPTPVHCQRLRATAEAQQEDEIPWMWLEEAADDFESLQASHDGLVEALRGFGDDYMVSDRHHPDHVLIPRVVFDRVCAALEAAGITEGTND